MEVDIAENVWPKKEEVTGAVSNHVLKNFVIFTVHLISII